jgi:hypothetical protein
MAARSSKRRDPKHDRAGGKIIVEFGAEQDSAEIIILRISIYGESISPISKY